MNLRAFFKHSITHWAKSSVDGYSKPTFSTPSSIYGRWEDKKTVVRASGIQELTSSTVVYTESVITAGDYLYLGSSTVSTPLTVSGAREVGAVFKSTSLDNSKTLYVVFLK